MTHTEHLSALSDTTPGTSPADPSTTTSTSTCPCTYDHDGSPMPTVRQRDARLNARTAAARTADPAGAEQRISRFIPGNERVDSTLDLIRYLARAAAPVNAQDAAEILTVLSGHAAYLDTVGTPVTVETLLDPNLVNRWVLHGLAGLTAGTTANYRSRLARVSAAVNGQPDRPAPLYASDPVRPYTRGDEDGLVRWAAGLADSLGPDLLTATGLTLGAGLTAAQVPNVRAGHIRDDGRGGCIVEVVGVEVAWNPVPVRTRYAQVLLDAAAGRHPDAYLFGDGTVRRGGRNAISNMVDAAYRQAGGQPVRLERFTPQRARATWIVRHLDAGTRMDLLMRAASVQHLDAFDRYVRYMAPASAGAGSALALKDEA